MGTRVVAGTAMPSWDARAEDGLLPLRELWRGVHHSVPLEGVRLAWHAGAVAGAAVAYGGCHRPHHDGEMHAVYPAGLPVGRGWGGGGRHVWRWWWVDEVCVEA